VGDVGLSDAKFFLLSLQTLRVGGVVSSQEEVAVQVTRVLVESYFDIVRGNLQDSVPKARTRYD